MIQWKIVTDDFGNEVSVTEIDWPHHHYFSRIVQRFFHWK